MEEWRLIEGTTDAFVSTGGAIAIGGVTITPKEDSEGYLRCTVAPKYRDRVHRMLSKDCGNCHSHSLRLSGARTASTLHRVKRLLRNAEKEG